MHASAANRCGSIFTENSLHNAFRSAFYDKEIYLPTQCGLNIKKLLVKFKQTGVTLKNPQVLFLLHEKKRFSGLPPAPSQLMPAKNRGHEKAWLFHVVLKIEDPVTGEMLILDLDHRPEPIPIAQYFDSMFPQNSKDDRLSLIPAKLIDVPAYLKAFEDFQATSGRHDQNEVVGAFRNPKDTRFPILTVRELLSAP